MLIPRNPCVCFRFYNGGLIFSTALLTSIAVISLYAFLLLVETRNKVPMSFGDIGGVLFGPTMRMSVLFAITLSQVKKNGASSCLAAPAR